MPDHRSLSNLPAFDPRLMVRSDRPSFRHRSRLRQNNDLHRIPSSDVLHIPEPLPFMGRDECRARPSWRPASCSAPTTRRLGSSLCSTRATHSTCHSRILRGALRFVIVFKLRQSASIVECRFWSLPAPNQRESSQHSAIAEAQPRVNNLPSKHAILTKQPSVSKSSWHAFPFLGAAAGISC